MSPPIEHTEAWVTKNNVKHTGLDVNLLICDHIQIMPREVITKPFLITYQ